MKNLDIKIAQLTLDEEKNLNSMLALSKAIKTLIETYRVIYPDNDSSSDFVTYTETISAMAQRMYDNSI